MNRSKTQKFSGQVHRQYRRDVAMLFRMDRAQRDGKPVKDPETVHRALIFPLKGNTDGLRFSDFAHDYNVVEGVGRGSLFHYLMTVHSAGFAVCEKADSAIALELASAYAEITAQLHTCAVDQTTGEVWSAFTFEALMSRISTQPRNTGGKDTSFTVPLVSVEWCKTLYGHGNLAKLATSEREHMIALAEHLAGEYESWPEFCKDKPRALGVIGDFLAARFVKTPPSLVKRYEALPRRPKEIAKAPIAFVGRPSLHGNDKYAPHRVVAQLLAEGILRHQGSPAPRGQQGPAVRAPSPGRRQVARTRRVGGQRGQNAAGRVGDGQTGADARPA